MNYLSEKRDTAVIPIAYGYTTKEHECHANDETYTKRPDPIPIVFSQTCFLWRAMQYNPVHVFRYFCVCTTKILSGKSSVDEATRLNPYNRIKARQTTGEVFASQSGS
jgi:hypothetical protein